MSLIISIMQFYIVAYNNWLKYLFLERFAHTNVSSSEMLNSYFLYVNFFAFFDNPSAMIIGHFSLIFKFKKDYLMHNSTIIRRFSDRRNICWPIFRCIFSIHFFFIDLWIFCVYIPWDNLLLHNTYLLKNNRQIWF